MAKDVITRFKLETTAFDSAIKRASKELSDYSKTATQAKEGFNQFTKSSVEAARALGTIATSSTNAKLKAQELVGAFNETAKAYNALTKEQQQSDFGKAMAASLTTLQQRIREVKSEMQGLDDSVKSVGGETGSVLDQLAGKFGLNVGQLAKFGGALGVATAAAKVAKDAFFANEQQLDEWGRTVEASQSLYRGFLNALNNGDISGFLSRINQITTAARAAYDALDALNTFNAFNQVNVEKTRTGMTESIADYREGNGSKDAVRAAGEAYKKELKERQKLEREAYLAAIEKTAAERGISSRDLQKALSGSYGSYQKLKEAPLTGSVTRFTGGGVAGVGMSYQMKVAANDQERLGESLRKLNDTELQSLQALGAQAERTGNEIASVDKQLSRVLRGNGGAGGSSGGGRSVGGGSRSSVVKTEEQLNSEKINSLTQEYVNATKERQTAIQSEIKGLQERNAEIQRLKDEAQGKIELFEPGTMKYYQNELKTLQEELLRMRETGEDPIAIEFKQDEIKTVQKEIDRLNGKVEVEVEVKVPPMSLEEQIRTELAASIEKADYSMMGNLMKAQIKYGLESVDFTPLQEALVEGMNIPDETWQAIIDKFNEQLRDKGITLTGDFDSGSLKEGSVSKENPITKLTGDLNKFSAGLGSLENGLTKLGIELPKEFNSLIGVLQGVSSVITGAQSVIQIFSTSSQTANTISLNALTAAVLANTAAINVNSAFSLIPFKNGGIVPHAASGYLVPGNDFSDKTPVLVSSGELILNKAQQGAIAEQLQGGGGFGGELTARVTAEDIIFVLNNNGLRRGYGKFIKG